MAENHRYWHTNIFNALWEDMITPKAAIGNSTYFLVYGKESILPSNLLLPSLLITQSCSQDDESSPLQDWGRNLITSCIITNNWWKYGLMISLPPVTSFRLGIWYLTRTNPTRTNETIQVSTFVVGIVHCYRKDQPWYFPITNVGRSFWGLSDECPTPWEVFFLR